MAIAITAPLGAPVISVSASSGGDSTMVAGTYEVAVCASNTSSYTLLTADQRRSPVSNIQTIVLTANQKITVSWSAITGATHYNVYVRLKVFGATDPYETWYGANRRCGSADLTATTTSTSYDITTRNNRRGAFDTFAYDTTYFQPPISKDLGTVVAHISGTNSGLYYSDLYNAMVSAGLTSYIANSNGQFWFKGQIIIDSGATGSIAPYNWKDTSDVSANDEWHLWGGIIQNNAPTTFTITWGTTQRGARLFMEAWSWNVDASNMDFTKCSVFGGNFGVLKGQAYIGSGDHYFRIKSDTISTDWMKLTGVNVQADKDPVVGVTTDASILPRTANGYIKNCNCETIGQTTSITGAVYVQDVVVGNVGFARHIRPRNSVSAGMFFIDCSWYNTATTFLNGSRLTFLERPEIYYESGASGLYNNIYQATMAQITVLDESGNAIQGATVKLENLTTVATLINESTNSSGQITETMVPYEVGVYDGSGVYGNGTGSDYSWKHTTWTEYNFRITITKDGYEAYKSDLKIKKGFKPRFTLKSQTPKLEDDHGNIYDRVDKTNSGSASLRRKLIKVA